MQTCIPIETAQKLSRLGIHRVLEICETQAMDGKKHTAIKVLWIQNDRFVKNAHRCSYFDIATFEYLGDDLD